MIFFYLSGRGGLRISSQRHIGAQGKKVHIQPFICALACAPKLVCVLICAPKLVCALIFALVCAPKLICAFYSSKKLHKLKDRVVV